MEVWGPAIRFSCETAGAYSECAATRHGIGGRSAWHRNRERYLQAARRVSQCATCRCTCAVGGRCMRCCAPVLSRAYVACKPRRLWRRAAIRCRPILRLTQWVRHFGASWRQGTRGGGAWTQCSLTQQPLDKWLRPKRSLWGCRTGRCRRRCARRRVSAELMLAQRNRQPRRKPAVAVLSSEPYLPRFTSIRFAASSSPAASLSCRNLSRCPRHQCCQCLLLRL